MPTLSLRKLGAPALSAYLLALVIVLSTVGWIMPLYVIPNNMSLEGIFGTLFYSAFTDNENFIIANLNGYFSIGISTVILTIFFKSLRHLGLSQIEVVRKILTYSMVTLLLGSVIIGFLYLEPDLFSVKTDIPDWMEFILQVYASCLFYIAMLSLISYRGNFPKQVLVGVLASALLVFPFLRSLPQQLGENTETMAQYREATAYAATHTLVMPSLQLQQACKKMLAAVTRTYTSSPGEFNEPNLKAIQECAQRTDAYPAIGSSEALQEIGIFAGPTRRTCENTPGETCTGESVVGELLETAWDSRGIGFWLFGTSSYYLKVAFSHNLYLAGSEKVGVAFSVVEYFVISGEKNGNELNSTYELRNEVDVDVR